MKHTIQKFIEKAQQVHGNKYDYSKVEYRDTHTKVCIICPEHGEFWQAPHNHLRGQGCSKCGTQKTTTQRRHTTQGFIEKAQQVHGDKYDYSKAEYINSQTKVCIICPEHGEFWQIPANHLSGQGCPKCGVQKRATQRRYTTQEFIEKVQQVHGNKYDYSKVEYVNTDTKVCIICPEHGEFWQTPYHHLTGNGCIYCSNKYLYTTQEFIEKAQQVHGDKYDYSKVNYINSQTKVCIICPEHGEFWQIPANHLSGQGCSKCVGKNRTTQSFIMECKQIHGDKYDYSHVEYKGINTKVCIICPEHGEFWQTPHNHLNERGCPKCSYQSTSDRCRKSLETFKQQICEIYGDNTFDLSKVDYVNSITKVCIIHPKHGEFWTTPNSLLSGRVPKIFAESYLERRIRVFLEKKNIPFEREKRFDWLIYNSNMRLDFYIEKSNIAIECQGIQHFVPTQGIYQGYPLDEQRKRDETKYDLCCKHGVKLIYFTNAHFIMYRNTSYIYDNNLFSELKDIETLLFSKF